MLLTISEVMRHNTNQQEIETMRAKKTNRDILSDFNVEILIVGDDDGGELKAALEGKLVEDISNRLKDEASEPTN